MPTSSLLPSALLSRGRGLLSVPVLVAFGLFASPARAVPGASMQLFRMDNRGVTAVPAISAVIDAASRPSPAAAPQTLAQATEAAPALDTLSQTFVGALPSNLAGNIRIVFVAEDGTLGAILEEIPFSSTRVAISPDRTQLSVRLSAPIQPGQSVMLQVPSTAPDGTPYVYPDHLASTPCVFKAPVASVAPVTPAPVPAPTPAAAAAGLPAWVYIVGAIVVGVGAAAAAGAFSSGGGGGGTNPVSQ